MSNLTFLNLRYRPVKEAEAVILPIPYEATITYGSGTREGPAAVLAASGHLEDWDEELKADISTKVRLATAPPLTPEVAGPQAMLDKIRKTVQPWISEGKTVFAIGGEHTISVGLVQAVQTKFPDLSIVALDAHADFRERYDGCPLSHACTLRRLYELGRPLTLLGVRSFSEEEHKFLQVAPRFRLFDARTLHSPEGWQAALAHLEKIPGPVYLTIDTDVLDPGVMPGVGTPEPGGLSYYQVLDLLKAVARRGPVVGLDLVELTPIPGNRVSEFTAARILYKALGYIYSSRI
jgi:agmatinase|uniref:Agmatinase n=1 Tax=Desulfobacca acetoxidans TaxID=60893 RepID=A0A7C5AMZ6_9BACT